MAETLGDRVRALRQRKGWTLKDLAAKTRLSVPYLSDIERRDETNPTLETLNTIAATLGCTVADLIGGDEQLAPSGPPLPETLRRYIKTEDFDRRIERLAQRAQRPLQELRKEVIDFLAVAPKRARGDLSAEDWRRLLDFYSVIVEE